MAHASAGGPQGRVLRPTMHQALRHYEDKARRVADERRLAAAAALQVASVAAAAAEEQAQLRLTGVIEVDAYDAETGAVWRQKVKISKKTIRGSPDK